MSGLLSLDRLSKIYAAPVLRELSLDVAEGELLGILGPSGCGKSTLLRLMASLEPPDRGTLLFDGSVATEPGPERILVLPDDNQLFPWLTAQGNVAFALRASGLPRGGAGRLLERVHLPDAASLYPHQLSSGMRQRVVLARALASSPRLLLMDEPFARLDAQTRGLLHALVLELWRAGGLTVVFVTHDILEAIRLSQRIVVMGRDGAPRADLANPLREPRDLTNPGLAALYARLEALLEGPRSQGGQRPAGGSTR